jgi:hypothetical protein
MYIFWIEMSQRNLILQQNFNITMVTVLFMLILVFILPPRDSGLCSPRRREYSRLSRDTERDLTSTKVHGETVLILQLVSIIA